MLNRRSILIGLITAPAIVRYKNIMPVRTMPTDEQLKGYLFGMFRRNEAITGAEVIARYLADGDSQFRLCTNPVKEIAGGLYTIQLSAKEVGRNTVLQFSAEGADDTMAVLETLS